MNIRLEWEHPNIGDIREVTCDRHSRVVMDALKLLGFGYAGSPAPGEDCLRCAVRGEPRIFLRHHFRMQPKSTDTLRADDLDRPNLGLATTEELLDEIRTRIEIDYYRGGGGLGYSTVAGRPEATLPAVTE